MEINETALIEIESLKSIYPDECQIQNREKEMDATRMLQSISSLRFPLNIRVNRCLLWFSSFHSPIVIVDNVKGLTVDDVHPICSYK